MSSERAGALWIKLLKGGSRHDVLGWYMENCAQPILPEGGGVLFGEHCRPGDEAAVSFQRGGRGFGFYLDSGRSEEVDGGEDADPPGDDHEGRRRFYTNRLLNDAGPGGAGASRPPFDGDVQALVFDVSRWAGSDTWLVCFENRDTGGRPTRRDRDSAEVDAGDEPDPPGLDPDGSDNDFVDVVFEVRTDGATPAHAISFGALKLRYR